MHVPRMLQRGHILRGLNGSPEFSRHLEKRTGRRQRGLKWLPVYEILTGDCNPGESDAASHCHYTFIRDLIRNIIIPGCSLIEFSMGFERETPCIFEKPSRLALIELTSMVETSHTHRASQGFDHCSTKVDKVLSERLLICKELLESRNLRITRSKTGLAG